MEGSVVLCLMELFKKKKKKNLCPFSSSTGLSCAPAPNLGDTSSSTRFLLSCSKKFRAPPVYTTTWKHPRLFIRGRAGGHEHSRGPGWGLFTTIPLPVYLGHRQVADLWNDPLRSRIRSLSKIHKSPQSRSWKLLRRCFRFSPLTFNNYK